MDFQVGDRVRMVENVENEDYYINHLRHIFEWGDILVVAYIKFDYAGGQLISFNKYDFTYSYRFEFTDKSGQMSLPFGRGF